jgi:hypothetical protein
VINSVHHAHFLNAALQFDDGNVTNWRQWQAELIGLFFVTKSSRAGHLFVTRKWIIPSEQSVGGHPICQENQQQPSSDENEN